MSQRLTRQDWPDFRFVDKPNLDDFYIIDKGCDCRFVSCEGRLLYANVMIGEDEWEVKTDWHNECVRVYRNEMEIKNSDQLFSHKPLADAQLNKFKYFIKKLGYAEELPIK